MVISSPRGLSGSGSPGRTWRIRRPSGRRSGPVLHRMTGSYSTFGGHPMASSRFHFMAASRSSLRMKKAPRLLGARSALRRPEWIHSTIVRGLVPWPTYSAACLVVMVLRASMTSSSRTTVTRLRSSILHSLQWFTRRYTVIRCLIKLQVTRSLQQAKERVRVHDDHPVTGLRLAHDPGPHDAHGCLGVAHLAIDLPEPLRDLPPALVLGLDHHSADTGDVALVLGPG